MSELYNAEYYHNGCGPIPYEEPEHWTKFFGGIADRIVEDLAPKTVLDAGCAMGYLVAALRDRGVEAYGLDISEYAISMVREDIRPYCFVGSLTEPLPKGLPTRFDLVTSIEVLEHIYAEDAEKAIKNLCAMTDRVVFSSTPSDFTERTHVNVQQPEYWAKRFFRHGFCRVVDYNADFISPHAVLYKKTEDISRVIEDYEREHRIYIAGGKETVGAKIYFGRFDGYSEEKSVQLPVDKDGRINAKIMLPSDCTNIRFDPVEGKGCFIDGMRMSTDSKTLNVANHNGIELGGIYLFQTIDPQIIFEDLPQDSRWIMLEASVLTFDSSGWIRLVDEVKALDTKIIDSQHQQEKELEDKLLAHEADWETQRDALQKKLERVRKLLRIERERNKAQDASSERECSKLKAKIQNYGNLLSCERTQTQRARERVQQLEEQVQSYSDLLDCERVQAEEADERIKQLEEQIQDYSNLVAYERVQMEKADERIKQLEEQIQDYSSLVAYERHEAAIISDTLQSISSSTCWRMTKPVRWTLDKIKWYLLRPIKKVLKYLKTYGFRQTAHKCYCKLFRKNESPQVQVAVQMAPVVSNSGVRSQLPLITGNPIDPIRAIYVDGPVKRLNLVTDTINADSLLGGVATALIVATEFANRCGYELRIITRNTEVNPQNYANIIAISGVRPAEKLSFYSDYDRFSRDVDFKLEISPDDIFFATSWWSAKAISETTVRKRFFYIIQEVETFFYNYGGERLLCEQVMKNGDIDFIINSEYLYQYFAEHEPNIADNGCFFEPAFPTTLYKSKSFSKKNKYKLFFYARPNNPRNLFTVGVTMLNKAVELGILDTKQWDIYCVGQDVPEMTFCDGSKSINLGQLSWTEYAEFLTDVDLALCLMYTPHPSYPPFDVACSGGVVLSNKMLNKENFDRCRNVILADLDTQMFMEAFKQAVELAKDMETRERNYRESTICRDWASTLEGVIKYMEERASNV